MNNHYDLLGYDKWNRRLINLYWVCNIIILLTEIILFIYLWQFDTLWFPWKYHIRNLIIMPTVLTCSSTILCEALIFIFKNRYRNIQPYVITFTCIALCTIIVIVHYTITVLWVAYIIPIIFTLIYDDKSVLRGTFICSLFTFIGIYFFYLNNGDLPFLRITPVDVITTIAMIIATYLICTLILSRYSQIIDILAATELAEYESRMAREYAEALAETRSQFLANMSHEIRTPLNGIIGLTELAIDEDVIFKKQSDYLIKVRDSAIGLLDIVNDILDISKIDAGELKLEKTPFSLKEVLTECETIVTHNAEQKELRLYVYNEVNIDKRIIGDSTRLRQALINLLSNAVKFTHKGSVTLLAKADETSLDGNKVSVYFEISDTGIGIAREQHDEIFEAFKQADDSITRNFGGTGLGLAITRSIVDTMGGKISVESIPNVGSKFSFSLEFEIFDEEIEHLYTRSIGINRPVFIGDALLCEDNIIGKQVAAENLERLGLKVTLAGNGKEAVDIVLERHQEGKHFDIIFMDIHMPVMDGLKATKKLIAMNIQTPIIALTANVMAEDRETYLKAGMRECLYKPFRAKELWACLLRYMTPVDAFEPIGISVTSDGGAPIDMAAGLENSAGSKSVYNKSLSFFAEESPKMLADLEKSVEDADFLFVNKTAHSAKNSAKIIGAEQLAEILTIIEESSRRDGSYFKKSMLEEYRAELYKVLDYITKINTEQSS